MGFDIYGEQLARGHCEVHPYVACEYPCPQCYAENDRHDRMRREQEATLNAQADEYYAQLFADEEYNSWFQGESKGGM